MADNGFHPAFPPDVRREVAALDESDTGTATRAVRNMRSALWSSIDNRSSRDLDQVEFVERLNDGNLRIRVGIADVDSLVPLGCATDDHARYNTTSVYTGVVVFPMLPERLSTDLTSLNEGKDRLGVVVELDIDGTGSPIREAVYRALIRNRAKLVYESIGDWLDGRGAIPARVRDLPGLEEQIRLQDNAAQLLRAMRKRNGALEFETVEAETVTVDGKVIDLKVTKHNRARDIIENFMVAANSAMARYLESERVSSIRRVVRRPKRWGRIVELAAEIGETLPQEPDSLALAGFLERRKAADPEHFADLSLSVVKLMGPGEYVLERRFSSRPDDSGHFGLAVAEYAHSTAPNRRFADLVTQRLVKSTVTGERPYSDEELAGIARRCTEQEDAANKVERTMRKKAAAFLMADRIGQSFVAIVTGASNKGTYVRLLNPPVEGRVLRGEKGLDVGDTVRVTLTGTDFDRGFIDFATTAADVAPKLARTRRKKAAAAKLSGRVGESFDAVVTSASPRGTYVRLTDIPAEGRVVRGHSALTQGERAKVTLINTDTVHGFIDFEYSAGVEPRKAERRRRKQEWARQLRERVGESFDAIVTGMNQKATFVRLEGDGLGAEGRLVRGAAGFDVGDHIRVVLLAADPERGFIDFAPDGG